MDFFTPANGLPPVTRAGRSKHRINTERLEIRRAAAGIAVETALRAATNFACVEVKSNAMLL